MIITCVCGEKKFNLPDGSIPATGRLVQCGFCEKKWTQYPLKQTPEIVKTPPIVTKAAPKKKSQKRKGPAPYSKEYMQEKWGTSIEKYAVDKGLTSKVKKVKTTTKIQKQPKSKTIEKPGFGFFNYIITYSILSIFLIGILNFERSRIGRKFPVLEPYIDHFFESLEIFKIFILDFFR